MPTFRECGQRSSPECVGPLKSHRPWSVSGVPSMSKHDTTLGSKRRRGDLGALGQGLIVTASSKIQGSCGGGYYSLLGEST